MPLNDPRLIEKAFRQDPGTPVTVPSQESAVRYLRSILTDTCGARFLYGPASSGKSTIIGKFAAELPHDVAAAVIDGSGLAPQQILSEVLSQFGYEMALESAEDLLRMIKVFAVQQTRACQAPILVVENIENMQPGALRFLCLLAALTFESQFAIRMVLTGSDCAPRLLKSEGMVPIAKRIASIYKVEPYSPTESMLYLHGRLRSFGVDQVERLFPMSICDELHGLSGGSPGALNERAIEKLKRARPLPPGAVHKQEREQSTETRPPTPKLIVTSNGETVEQHVFREKKVTIGRSGLADIVLHDQYASKFHALAILYADALILIDLNSSNGIFVNSVKINCTILRSDDIITIANHRIKVVDAPQADSDRISSAENSDTAKMKALDDLREERKAQVSFLHNKKKLVG